jgi:hypothetical protein
MAMLRFPRPYAALRPGIREDQEVGDSKSSPSSISIAATWSLSQYSCWRSSLVRRSRTSRWRTEYSRRRLAW